MQKAGDMHLAKAMLLCLALLLLAPNVTLASDMISFPGFERALKQYEKRAHWEPSYVLTTDKEDDPFSLSEGCECIVTTRHLRLFDDQETTDLKQWASFELTVVDRECQGDIMLEQCYDKVTILSRIDAYVTLLQTHAAYIFRYSIPGVDGASEHYTEHNPDFEIRCKHAIMFWEKYANQ